MASEIFGPVPYFKVRARREFLSNLDPAHEGKFVGGIAYGVRCLRGHSLWFQVMLCDEGYGGISYLLPIQGLATPFDPAQPPLASAIEPQYVQPWDTFSSTFGVAALPFVARGKVSVLPGRKAGRYLFTIDFAGSDIAEDVEQHKHLHVVEMDEGWIGAFPNNRLLWHDPAFWKTVEDLPRLASLEREFRAE
jgi:hypothetical protein